MKVSQAILSISTLEAFTVAAPTDPAATPAVVPAAVGNITAVYPNSYCTFYSDSACTQMVGGDAYNVYNENCFSNTGGYIMCSSGNAIEPGFILVQSPDSDDNCYCQSNCIHFGSDEDTQSPWNTCTAIDLTPGYTSFRIEHDMDSCAANNC